MACLQSLHETITSDIESLFQQHQTTKEAMQEMIEKLIQSIEVEETIASYTFSSMVSEIIISSKPVQIACNTLYEQIGRIYTEKLQADGYAEPDASAISVLMVSAMEGAMLLCLTQHSSTPLKTVSASLPSLLKEQIYS